MVFPAGVDDELIGTNLRRLREALGMSQADLASAASKAGWEGIYPQTILKLEKGLRSLKLSEAVVLAKIMGVRESEIVDVLTTGASASQAHLLGQIRARYSEVMSNRMAGINHIAEMLRGRKALKEAVAPAVAAGHADDTIVSNARWFTDKTDDDMWLDIRDGAESLASKEYGRG